MPVPLVDTLTPIPLTGHIGTDAAGFAALVNWHKQCAALTEQGILIDLNALKWLDANQCALFRALLHDLQESNGLHFMVGGHAIQERFPILLRNGFLIDHDDPSSWSAGTSSVCMRQFNPSASDEFYLYVEEDLFGQPDLVTTCANQWEIVDHLMDLFANVELHAQTTKPVFACGQYFPKHKRLKFSIVDSGCGYLAPIQYYTSLTSYKGNPITQPELALRWALAERNTTKTTTTGGMGLKRLLDYCLQTGGELHIVSDGQYLTAKGDDKGKLVCRTVPVPYLSGSTVHLIFNCEESTFCV